MAYAHAAAAIPVRSGRPWREIPNSGRDDDAAGRRATEARADPDPCGYGTATTALTYSDRWQVLQASTAGPSVAASGYQYAWSPFYVDDLIERDTLASATAMTPVVGGGSVVASTDPATGDLVLSRFAADGSAVASFGTDGVADTGIVGTATAVATAGGRIYVAFSDMYGHVNVAAFAVATGAVVTSFGNGADYADQCGYGPAVAGVATAGFGGTLARATAVAVDAAGRPVVAGWSALSGSGYGDKDLVAARFTTDGALDATFGSGGEVTVGGEGALQDAVAVDGSGGRVAVAGSEIVVLTAAGEPDTTFHYDGVAPAGRAGAGANAVAFDAAGRLVAVRTYTDLGGTAADVTRYTTQGSADGTFGTGGTAQGVGPGGGFEPAGVAVDSTGRVTVLGHGDSAYGPVAVHLTAAGAADNAYGTGGAVVVADVTVGGVSLTAAGDGVATGSSDAVGFATLAAVPADRVYPTHDANHNTTALTDAGGAVVERYGYGPYGAVTVLTPDGSTRSDGTAAAGLFAFVVLYQGRSVDVTTGTYDFRNRVYVVSLGRFAQQDPAGYVNGINIYQVELGDPISQLDCLGTQVGGGEDDEEPGESKDPVLERLEEMEREAEELRRNALPDDILDLLSELKRLSAENDLLRGNPPSNGPEMWPTEKSNIEDDIRREQEDREQLIRQKEEEHLRAKQREEDQKDPNKCPNRNVSPNKTPLPTMKPSPFGPKIADEVPKDGVPGNWSKEQIDDAITDYGKSIESRIEESLAFDFGRDGGGTPEQRLAHTRRITEEQSFLISLLKARKDMGD